MNRKEDIYDARRRKMVERQLVARGVCDSRVVDAMAEMPRHLFLPEELRGEAYEDRPVTLGPDQTISQPLIVAEMLELLNLSETDKVLEVGTGSGYVAALLSRLCGCVYTIEIDELLHQWATIVLKRLQIENVKLKLGNGYEGWPEEAPFDKILLSAASPTVPQKLVEQLKVEGRLVLPLGVESQSLTLVRITAGGVTQTTLEGVRFVMMKAK